MANAAIGLDALKPLQVHSQFPAQIAFNHILALLHRVNDLRELLLSQRFGADAMINAGFVQDDPGVYRANAVNITERDIDPFFTWNINT